MTAPSAVAWSKTSLAFVGRTPSAVAPTRMAVESSRPSRALRRSPTIWVAVQQSLDVLLDVVREVVAAGMVHEEQARLRVVSAHVRVPGRADGDVHQLPRAGAPAQPPVPVVRELPQGVVPVASVVRLQLAPG